PRYGFGFGLSYSTFRYSRLSLPTAPVRAGDSLTVAVNVTNQSQRAGDEVVQLYLEQPSGPLTPKHILAGFTRVNLAAGQTLRVLIRVAPRTMAVVNEAGDRIVQAGTYGVSVSGAQPGATAGGVRGTFTVSASAKLSR
ncbi:MAG: fibronectin type III-like domain-contianing protein, partial [Gemmatimonadaceae bacterium]